jgi:diacylglycerol kinase
MTPPLPPRNITLPQSFGYAIRGIWLVARSERNFQIHLVASVVVVILAIVVRCSAYDWAILCLAMGLVLVAESLNTAIETVVDLVSPEYHPLAGRAKDIAAGGVLLAALTAVAVAGWILLIPLYQWMQR